MVGRQIVFKSLQLDLNNLAIATQIECNATEPGDLAYKQTINYANSDFDMRQSEAIYKVS